MNDKDYLVACCCAAGMRRFVSCCFIEFMKLPQSEKKTKFDQAKMHFLVAVVNYDGNVCIC